MHEYLSFNMVDVVSLFNGCSNSWNLFIVSATVCININGLSSIGRTGIITLQKTMKEKLYMLYKDVMQWQNMKANIMSVGQRDAQIEKTAVKSNKWNGF